MPPTCHRRSAGFFKLAPGPIWDPGVVKNGFLAKFHAGLTYFHNFSMGFLKIVIFRSAIKPRCAYFSGFKRFSKNRQKVHEMTPTEATVASGVKNWYINFFFSRSREMPIGAKTVKILEKSEFFDYKVFRAPPRVQEKTQKWGLCGTHGEPWGPMGTHGDPWDP